jgi:2-keto-4-pentenoate hydratase/2-oxohepta-3-ene-1,7-dioic acid hydratase in catechol pathway
MTYSLMTVRFDGRAIGCLERDGKLYRLTDVGAPDAVGALFEDWPRWSTHLATAKPSAGALPANLEVLAPLLYPGKILCAGANYYDHSAEMGIKDLRKEAQRLFFFFKPPRNAVVGPGATVRYPLGSASLDWEVELALVIGRRARAVSVADAMSHVAAYTVAIDFSARDLGRAPETFYKIDWVAGKAHDTCCPMGPRLVPADAIGDPQDLGLRLSVNGELKQNARSSGMIFSIAEQISILSRIMTLDPGDVVLTGTPAGVGAPKGTFLSVGDRVDAEIEKIGALSVTIQRKS